MCPSTTTVAAFPVARSVRPRLRCRRLAVGFHVDADGPDEPQQLATDRGHHLLFTFAPRGQCAVAGVQPVLRLPRDRFHLGTDGGLALAQRGAHRRAVPIGPGRFDDDATEMGIARFGNPAAPGPRRRSNPRSRRPRCSPSAVGVWQSARARRLPRRSSRPRPARSRAAPAAPRSPRACAPAPSAPPSSIARSSRVDAIGHVLDLVEVVQQRRLLRRRAQSGPRSSPTRGAPASTPSSPSAAAGHAATEICPSDGARAVDPSSPPPGRAPDPAALRAPRRAPTPASSRPRDNSAPASARRAGPSSRDRPALTGTNVGATTSHVTPSAVSCQYTTYPVGPAS